MTSLNPQFLFWVLVVSGICLLLVQPHPKALKAQWCAQICACVLLGSGWCWKNPELLEMSRTFKDLLVEGGAVGDELSSGSPDAVWSPPSALGPLEKISESSGFVQGE